MREQQKAEEKCQRECEHYSNSHVCALVSDVSVKINHNSSVPQTPLTPLSINTEAWGGGMQIYSGDGFFCFVFLFFFSLSWEKTGEKERAETAVN